MIDTHCHLADADFDADRIAVIERARKAGVTHALMMGENLRDNEAILAIDDADGFLLRCAGHYPSELDVDMAQRTEDLIRANRDRITAIGEVGIDHRITEDARERETQYEIFRRFATLSAECDLPLSVHSRSAGRHAIAILLESPATKVVMHAFDGKYGAAMPAIAAGYYFSVPPSIVRSRQKQKLVKNIPIENLLLESDAPVLGPTPDERNEPCNIDVSARAIAEIKALPIDEVREITTASAARLFAIRRA